MTSLTTLIERLESGSGKDRELDGDVMFTLFAKPAGERGYLWPEDNPSWSFAIRFPGKDRAWFDKRRGRDQETIVIWRDGDPILMNSLRVRPLTSSLEAALEIAEAVLPGWLWRVQWTGKQYIHTRHGDLMAGEYGEGGSDSPARATLIAVLRALEEQQRRALQSRETTDGE